MQSENVSVYVSPQRAPFPYLLLMLKLDQKYFIPFIAITTIILTAAIFVYSLEYSDTQRQEFLDEVYAFDWEHSSFSLADDSTQAIALPSDFQVLFMAAWSPKSIEASKELLQIYPDSTFFLALVKDSLWMVKKDWPEIPQKQTISGTALYQTLKTVGLPTLITVKNQITDTVIIGYRGPDSYREIELK